MTDPVIKGLMKLRVLFSHKIEQTHERLRQMARHGGAMLLPPVGAFFMS